MAGKPGSEQAHEAHIRELAGEAADHVMTAPKKYPKEDADAMQIVADAGAVGYISRGPDMRYVFYRDGEGYHAIVTSALLGGYRRGYKKVSGRTAADVLTQLDSA